MNQARRAQVLVLFSCLVDGIAAVGEPTPLESIEFCIGSVYFKKKLVGQDSLVELGWRFRDTSPQCTCARVKRYP